MADTKIKPVKITKTGAVRIIKRLAKQGGGKVFHVVFLKRETNERREMRCAFGIEEGITGNGLAFDPTKLHLVNVYDMDKSAYRMISLERLIEIKIGNKHYIVKGVKK